MSVNEAFGYTHKQTLDSSYTLMVSMMSEYAYMMKERYADDKEDESEEFEWIELPDWNDPTKTNRVKKYKDVGMLIRSEKNL